MNQLAFLLTLLIFSLTTLAQEPTKNIEQKTATLTIEVGKTVNNKGSLLIALHTEDTFMKGKGIKNASKLINGDKTTVIFEEVPLGEYAIMVLHDQNNNHRMDYTEQGIPKEDYGLSNNDMSFGPPQFETAKFNLTNQHHTIKIRL